jgi:hypothetical protein
MQMCMTKHGLSSLRLLLQRTTASECCLSNHRASKHRLLATSTTPPLLIVPTWPTSLWLT